MKFIVRSTSKTIFVTWICLVTVCGAILVFKNVLFSAWLLKTFLNLSDWAQECPHPSFLHIILISCSRYFLRLYFGTSRSTLTSIIVFMPWRAFLWSPTKKIFNVDPNSFFRTDTFISNHIPKSTTNDAVSQLEVFFRKRRRILEKTFWQNRHFCTVQTCRRPYMTPQSLACLCPLRCRKIRYRNAFRCLLRLCPSWFRTNQSDLVSRALLISFKHLNGLSGSLPASVFQITDRA